MSRRRNARRCSIRPGASGPGKSFAARHAECVFVAAPTKEVLRSYVAEVRRQAAHRGPRSAQALTYNLCTVIVDETDAKAQAKFDGVSPVRILRWRACVHVRMERHRLRSIRARPTSSRKSQTNAIISVVDHLAGGGKDLDDRGACALGRHRRSWARSLLGRRRRSRTFCRNGSRRQMLTASISLMR